MAARTVFHLLRTSCASVLLSLSTATFLRAPPPFPSALPCPLNPPGNPLGARPPSDPSALPRKPVPSGTSPLEARPLDKTAIGVPAAAEANAERGSSSINTKESGREVPAGALGSVSSCCRVCLALHSV